jgi:hypothetical protein
MKCPEGETYDRTLKMCRAKKSPGRPKAVKSSALEACEAKVEKLQKKIDVLAPRKPDFNRLKNADVKKFFKPRQPK